MAVVMSDQWEVDAACQGADPDLFFPERGAPTAAAKAVCAGCPVQFDCLRDALDRREKFGIWGGLSERERRGLRRRISQGAPVEAVAMEALERRHQAA